MYKRMSTFLFTLLGLTVGSSDPCAMKREIAPCTCRLEGPKIKRIIISCEQMASFGDIIAKLGNRFPPEQDISLKINYSDLSDMMDRSFKELGLRVSNLKLSFDDLSQLSEDSFKGLGEVEHFSLADNRLLEIPRDVLKKMPKLKILDLGRSRISNLSNKDFQELPVLQHLLLPGNLLSRIESDAFPKTLRHIHIGKNLLKNLNGSLRGLNNLEWLFINENQITTLQEQLPPQAPKLTLIHAGYNHIPDLPAELKNYSRIDTLFLSNNEISSVGGVLKKARLLKLLDLSHNKIHTLADDDFAEAVSLETIKLGYNYLKEVNKTFLPLKNLQFLNLTHNYLTSFSFEEIRGLRDMILLDLSHNKITHLTNGGMENLVEEEMKVQILQLEGNEIKTLGKSLSRIRGLQRINLSHNKLMKITPGDFSGLKDLQILDISHNRLTTLDGLVQPTSLKTSLPLLEELIANNNLLRVLERDFHGLPVLCKADLSQNQIVKIGPDLISKTRCEKEGVPGVLRIYLYDNPVLCNGDFNLTADYMKENFTLLQGDFGICPAITPSNESSVSTVSEIVVLTPTEITHAEPVENIKPIFLTPQLVINQQAVPFPLLINPQRNGQEKKEILIGEKAPLFDILTTDFNDKNVNNHASGNNITTEDIKTAVVDGNILETVMIHSPIIVKDEGANVTLFIPMENGAIGKDHEIDQYIQKKKGINILNQTQVSHLITNIDIVEIKQLPDDSSSASASTSNSKKADIDHGN